MKLRVALAVALGSAGLGAAPPRLVVQTGHFQPVSTVAFSPDSRLLATGGDDRAILVWNTATGDQLRSLTGHEGRVTAIAFGPDGAQLASGSTDGTARIWNALTGTPVRTIPAHTLAIDAIALSPDGQTLATGSFDHTIKLWDVATGTERRLLTGHTGGVAALAFSPDGRLLASGSHDHTVRVWEMESGGTVRTFAGHPAAVMGIAFSADGRWLASSGGGLDGQAVAIVWDVATGEPRHRFGASVEWISSVAFSRDGRFLVGGANLAGQALRIWDLETGRAIAAPPTRTGTVYAVAFSPDGKQLAYAGADHAIVLCDAQTWTELRPLQGHASPINAVALSPDGRQLASARRSRDIQLWNLTHTDEPRTLHGHESDVTALAFSPVANLLASASTDETVRLWDPVTGRTVRTLAAGAGAVNGVAFSPDGQLLASGGNDFQVRLWHVADGRPAATLHGHLDYVEAVAFSPDGRIVASASDDTTIRLWSTVTGERLRTLEGHDHWVRTIAFSPDGDTLASGSIDATIKLWSLRAGGEREPRTLRGHVGPVDAVVFLADGATLASGGRDGTVRFWEVKTGRERDRSPAHHAAVTTLAFAPATGCLASGSADTRIELWDAAAGRPLAGLVALDASDWAVVAPDGRFDASPGGRKLMHWVLGNEAIALEQLKGPFWRPGLLPKLLGFDREPLESVDPAAPITLAPTVGVRHAPTAGHPVRFAITVRNRGSGLGRVEVFVNEKRILKDAREPGFDAAAPRADLVVDLAGAPFRPGQPNTVRVIAWTAGDRFASDGATTTYLPPAPFLPPRPPELYAIVAGVSTYAAGGVPHLHFAARDAADFATTLQLGAARLFGATRVHLTLLSTGSDPRARPPTKANLRDAFLRARQARPDDILVVYLAGHGLALHRDRDLYCFLTRDAGTMELDTVTDPALFDQWTLTSEELAGWTTGREGVQALKQVMILDTCAAGSAAGQLAATRGTAADRIRAIDQMKDSSGFHVLMGCAANQSSYETSRYGHGVLTYALLEGMKGAQALRPGDFIDVRGLFSYAERQVPVLAQAINGIQKPRPFAPHGDMANFDIGELTTDDRAAIPLKPPKPWVTHPMLTNPDPAVVGDPLRLTAALNDALRSDYLAKEDTLAAGSPIAYVDTTDLSEAIEPVGNYTVKDGTVYVTLALHQNGRRLKIVQVDGPAADLPALVARMVAIINDAVATLDAR